jgi:hypothetical protein
MNSNKTSSDASGFQPIPSGNPLHLKYVLAIFLLLAVVVTIIFQTIPDPRMESGWCQIVMRNWQSEGFSAMRGQLVANYGGLSPNEEPVVYPGHRPEFLYIPYFLKYSLPFGDARGILYVVFMTSISFWGIARLFAYRPYGITAACLFCVCPGYIANIALIDTISFPGVLGVSTMCLAASFLIGKRQTTAGLVAVGLGMALFMTLNWSTLFSLAILGMFVLASGSRRKSVYLVLISAGLVGIWTLYLAMKSRAAGNGPAELWDTYLFGPLGYDKGGMTWSKAGLRILAVNLVAWLPLVAWFVVGMSLMRPRRHIACLLPLIGSLLVVLSMRNYHAHHPWGAVSFIALGLLMTMALMQPEFGVISRPFRRKSIVVGITAAGILYAFTWVAFDTHNKKEYNNLHDLIFSKTPRNSRIFFVENPWTNNSMIDWNAFSLQFDRKISSKDERLRDPRFTSDSIQPEYFVSTQFPPAGSHLVASQSCKDGAIDAIMESILNFYREKVSKRTTGDRKTYAKTFYLYTEHQEIDPNSQ